MKKGLNALAVGWNTWNTRSVLSQVLLPERISLSLGFKHYGRSDYLREALIGRNNPRAETVLPGTRSYDGSFTDLTLRWEGAEWRVQTALAENADELVVLVESTGAKQTRAPLVVAELGILWGREGCARREGATLVAETPARRVQVFATHETEAEPYIWSASPYLAQKADAECGFSTGRRRSVDDIRAIVERRRAERENESRAFGDAAEIRDAMQTCLAWNTVYDPLHDRVISPVSRIWNCNWGGYVLFCWDSYFAAMMAAEDNKELAYANAYAVTKEGIECGMIPNFVSPSGYFSRDRSQPPVGSYAVLSIFKKYRETQFLEELFPDLLEWNRWWPEHRDADGLLAWGSDPYAPVAGNVNETLSQRDGRFGAALESGLDNAPMYDGIPFDEKTRTLALQDVGLTALYVWDCDALAEIAERLDRRAENVELRARAEKYRAALQRLWNEEKGIFLNRRTDTGEWSMSLSPTNFYPLLARAATPQQAGRMMSEHFFNPQEFWGDWILPSCARNDAAYPEQDYWRGRIWAPMNFLVYLGLRNYDLPAARRALVEKSAALLLKEWREHAHVHENYCADTGAGCNAKHGNSDAFYHWGGLLGLITLYEQN